MPYRLRDFPTLALALAFALALALMGCSSDEASGSSDTGGADIPTFQGVFDTVGGGTDKDGGALSDVGVDGASAETTFGGDAAPTGDGTAAAEDSGGGFDYPCVPGTIQACETACGSTGKQKCLKDWGPCIPIEEQCGNCLDDDCDGRVDESCPPDPTCNPPEPQCPIAVLNLEETPPVGTGTLLHLSAIESTAPDSTVAKWQWSVSAPAGSTSAFEPSDDVQAPALLADVAGSWLISLEVWDLAGNPSCVTAQVAVSVEPFPPADPEPGCADGTREGFLELGDWPQVAACAGAWSEPGITPDDVVPTCGRQGGDDGPNPDGSGCASADLCAEGWHVCEGWQELSKKSTSGCAGAAPPGAKDKSLFFALRQWSENNIVCGEPGDGYNDVFGCGNLGVAIGDDKGCGPLDRALASTQPDTCGFNEAQPPLGPWECVGGVDSHYFEGQVVTKKGCPGGSCSYDGQPVGSSDKGGVICCRD